MCAARGPLGPAEPAWAGSPLSLSTPLPLSWAGRRWLLAFETRLGQEQGVYDNSLGSITPLTFFPGEN